MKIFIAQTIDGYIAGPNGSLDHLAPFQDNDYGYEAFIQSVDAVVIGRRTFDAIYPKYGWTYPAHLPGVVITSRPLPEDTPNQVIGCADIDRIIRDFGNAYVDGGGQIIRLLCNRGAIREAHIFTLPLLLGNGIRLFPSSEPQLQPWRLIDSHSYSCGTVRHHYRIG